MRQRNSRALLKNVHQTLRWYVKKTARFTVATIGSILFSNKASVPCVRVLTYHRFGNDHRDPFCVTPADFDAQMKMLRSERRAVSLEQVIKFLEGEEVIPQDACLVTIDDGMQSTLTEALPILEKYDIPCVAFVSSKLVGLDLPDLDESYLDETGLKLFVKSPGMSIGSHAHTHRSMGELPLDEMQKEAVISKDLLTKISGRDVNAFAYPFGMQRDFNTHTDNALKNAGYGIAFNSMHGAIREGMDPVSLPRVKIEGGESLRMFNLISRGAMDIWRLVDNLLWRLQRVRREIS